MIKEVTKYYSDIDTDYYFSTAEQAENFERTYKPFYDLNDEVELCIDSIVGKPYPKHYPEPKELAKTYFDKAKVLLDEYFADKNPIKRLKNIEYNKEDIGFVVNIFQDKEYDSIISVLFDNIYWIMIEKI